MTGGEQLAELAGRIRALADELADRGVMGAVVGRLTGGAGALYMAATELVGSARLDD